MWEEIFLFKRQRLIEKKGDKFQFDRIV